VDAGRVLQFGVDSQASLIVIGQSTDEEGTPNAAGRRALRFAEELRGQTKIPIVMWDESLSTQDARTGRIASGVPRKKRAARVDSLAATVILQSYLDAHRNPDTGSVKP
jgi:putative Holliday junction resolvase